MTGPVAEPGTGDQQHRVGDGVSGDHQLQVGPGSVEFGADGGGRDVHDEHVEQRHELGGREHELPVMVATLRSWYGRHVGEPAWEDFIRGLSAVSPYFAELWASGEVIQPGPRVKTFRHEAVGELRMTSQSLAVDGMPECRIVVYTPEDEAAREKVALLREYRQKIPPPDGDGILIKWS